MGTITESYFVQKGGNTSEDLTNTCVSEIVKQSGGVGQQNALYLKSISLDCTELSFLHR